MKQVVLGKEFRENTSKKMRDSVIQRYVSNFLSIVIWLIYKCIYIGMMLFTLFKNWFSNIFHDLDIFPIHSLSTMFSLKKKRWKLLTYWNFKKNQKISLFTG